MLNTPNGFGTIRSIIYFCINNDFKYNNIWLMKENIKVFK